VLFSDSTAIDFGAEITSTTGTRVMGSGCDRQVWIVPG